MPNNNQEAMARLVVDTNSLVVTDDNHFDVLKKMDFPKIDVIGLDEIIQQIK